MQINNDVKCQLYSCHVVIVLSVYCQISVVILTLPYSSNMCKTFYPLFPLISPSFFFALSLSFYLSTISNPYILLSSFLWRFIKFSQVTFLSFALAVSISSTIYMSQLSSFYHSAFHQFFRTTISLMDSSWISFFFYCSQHGV